MPHVVIVGYAELMKASRRATNKGGRSWENDVSVAEEGRDGEVRHYGVSFCALGRCCRSLQVKRRL